MKTHISKREENKIIDQALAILKRRIVYSVDKRDITSPNATRTFLKLKLEGRQSEVFAVLFLDQHHRLIKYEELFTDTIGGCSVYPREVIRRTLEVNAAAVVFAHNHPSGIAEPSINDEQITKRLKNALAYIDVNMLDHLIVGEEIVSFSERGLL